MSNGGNDGDEQPFPRRLFHMLNSDQEVIGGIVSFLPHGRAFLIHNVDRFYNQVLPVWFDQMDRVAFEQQLQLFGFRQLTQGPDQGAYYHAFFLRNNPHLLGRIRELQGASQRAASEEPNFHAMPSVAAGGASPQRIAHTGNIPLNLIPGCCTLPPAAVGFPVLHRLLLPSASREDAMGINSNSAFVDRFNSEEQIHDILRAFVSDGENDEDEEDLDDTDDSGQADNN